MSRDTMLQYTFLKVNYLYINNNCIRMKIKSWFTKNKINENSYRLTFWPLFDILSRVTNITRCCWLASCVNLSSWAFFSSSYNHTFFPLLSMMCWELASRCFRAPIAFFHICEQLAASLLLSECLRIWVGRRQNLKNKHLLGRYHFRANTSNLKNQEPRMEHLLKSFSFLKQCLHDL